MTIQAIQRSELWNFNMVPSGSVSLWDSGSPPRWVQMFSLSVSSDWKMLSRATAYMKADINRKSRATRGNKARQMFSKVRRLSTTRAVHFFLRSCCGPSLSSSSPLVHPLLLLLLHHPHTLPNTVRHFPPPPLNSNHKSILGWLINLDKSGKCPLFSAGCSLLLRTLCVIVCCRRWLALLPLQQRSIWNAWLRQAGCPGCCQDTADATEEETRQRPPSGEDGITGYLTMHSGEVGRWKDEVHC